MLFQSRLAEEVFFRQEAFHYPEIHSWTNTYSFKFGHGLSSEWRDANKHEVKKHA